MSTAIVAEKKFIRGEAHDKAKLTESGVLAIRASVGTTIRDIAKQYGVGKTTIANVLARRTWTHI